MHMNRQKHPVLAWVSFGLLCAALLGYGTLCAELLRYESARLSIGSDGIHITPGGGDINPITWAHMFVLTLAAAAAVCGALFAAKGSRKLGIAAFILEAAGAAGYLCLPSTSLMLPLYTRQRTLSDLGLPLLPGLFPLYPWLYLAGFVLLVLAFFLPRRRPAPNL